MAKYILPALALVGTAFAQCSGDITISTTDDATAIASCLTYNGTITIDPSASGSISVNGIRSIQGDFVCLNATNLNSISTDQLATITGTFHLEDLIVLSNLEMSSLTRVNRINWINLPGLQALNFDQGVNGANQIYISNTALGTLSGIELTQIGSMDVNNCPELEMINVNALTNVTTSLSFSANGKNLAIQFPNLIGAANLTFRDVSAIDMPSLYEVPGAVGFYSDTFTNFTAANLTRIGQSLSFVDCPNLATLQLPELNLVGGGFLLANNSKLTVIDGFPSLARIGGAIDFAGDFSSVELPALTDVKGGANIQTSSTNSSLCAPIKSYGSSGVIHGSVNCVTGASNPQNNGSSSGSSSKSAASATGFNLAALMTGVVGLAAAMFFL